MERCTSEPFIERTGGVRHVQNVGRRVAPRPRGLVRTRPSHRGPPGFPHPSRRAPDASPDDPREVLDLPEHDVAGLHLGFDLLDSVQSRCVITPSE